MKKYIKHKLFIFLITISIVITVIPLCNSYIDSHKQQSLEQHYRKQINQLKSMAYTYETDTKFDLGITKETRNLFNNNNIVGAFVIREYIENGLRLYQIKDITPKDHHNFFFNDKRSTNVTINTYRTQSFNYVEYHQQVLDANGKMHGYILQVKESSLP